MLIASVTETGKVTTFPHADANGVVDIIWNDDTGEIEIRSLVGDIDHYGLSNDVFVKKTADGVMVDRDGYENDVFVRKTDNNSVFIDCEGAINDVGIRHNGEDSIIIQHYAGAQNDIVLHGKGKTKI
jgi:hypothetical protein